MPDEIGLSASRLNILRRENLLEGFLQLLLALVLIFDDFEVLVVLLGQF